MPRAKSNRVRYPSNLLMATQQYTYECDSGHWLTSPQDFVRCPALVKGKPCADLLRTPAAAASRRAAEARRIERAERNGSK